MEDAKTIERTKIQDRTSSAKQDIILSLADFTAAVRADASVKREPVTFRNADITMAGVLFFPADLAAGAAYPAIAVVHPAGGIKEQTASLYAYRLAQNGYIALAYDASHQGESGEERRLSKTRQRGWRTSGVPSITSPHCRSSIASGSQCSASAPAAAMRSMPR